MNPYFFQSNRVIWLSFLIMIILQITPWPSQLYFFRPSWLNLMLIYWNTTLPQRINLGTSFLLGLLTDLIFGSILGVRALGFSILSYLVTVKSQIFRNTALWLQAIAVALFSLIMQLVVFLVEFLLINISFRSEILCTTLVDGVVWPWFCLLMRKIHSPLILK